MQLCFNEIFIKQFYNRIIGKKSYKCRKNEVVPKLKCSTPRILSEHKRPIWHKIYFRWGVAEKWFWSYFMIYEKPTLINNKAYILEAILY